MGIRPSRTGSSAQRPFDVVTAKAVTAKLRDPDAQAGHHQHGLSKRRLPVSFTPSRVA